MSVCIYSLVSFFPFISFSLYCVSFPSSFLRHFPLFFPTSYTFSFPLSVCLSACLYVSTFLSLSLLQSLALPFIFSSSLSSSRSFVLPHFSPSLTLSLSPHLPLFPLPVPTSLSSTAITLVKLTNFASQVVRITTWNSSKPYSPFITV